MHQIVAPPDRDLDTSTKIAAVIRLTAWTSTLLVGALQTWAGRFPIGEDGVSYLDIADSYLRGDLRHAINAYWSPLYSWVLAFGLGVTKPSAYMESTVVHGLNFIVFIASFTAFDQFLQQLLAARQPDTRDLSTRSTIGVPTNAVLVAGYAAFLWVTINWISVPLETPDMCLTVFIYAAATLLVRMRQSPTARTFTAFGALLGFAFLTKSVMLPLSPVFLTGVLIAVRERSRALRGIAIAMVAMAVVAAPHVAAISLAKGRFTTGDIGRLAYIWHSAEATSPDFSWHAEFPDDHRPLHPTHKIFDRPATYAFGFGPQPGAYPVWYDPSYWHDGLPLQFNLTGQLNRLRWSLETWWRMFVREAFFIPLACLAILVLSFQTWRVLMGALTQFADLLVPFVVALPLYSVVRLSPRYVAVFVLLFVVAFLSSIRLPATARRRRNAWAVAIALALTVAVTFIPWTLRTVAEIRAQQEPESHMFWTIADGLTKMGALPGDGVICLGYGPPAYWARLAHVRIVGEVFSEMMGFKSIPNVTGLLASDGSLTPEAVAAFSTTGAKFLVARKIPAEVARHGWTELGTHTDWWGLAIP